MPPRPRPISPASGSGWAGEDRRRGLDALILPFLFAALAEIGARTQLLSAQLGTRWRRPRAVLAGIALGALSAAVLAAVAGRLVADTLPFRAGNLLLALGLLVVAAGQFGRTRCDDDGRDWRRLGAFGSSVAAVFVVGVGDGATLGTMAFVARGGDPWLVAPAAAIGALVLDIPAALGGIETLRRLPLRPVRITVAVLFAAIGIVLGLAALRLV